MPIDRVLITGTSTGIGRATAELLAEKGYRVVATMRNTGKGSELVERAQSKGWDLAIIPLDVRNDESVEAAFQQAGEIDVLVNNAGFSVRGAVEEITLVDLIDQFETNVYGVFRCIQAALPSMRKRGHGIIVNVSSVGGLVGHPFNSAYASSKHALEGLTESLHHEIAPFGVRVHLIEPGLVGGTAFFDNWRSVGGSASETSSPYATFIPGIEHPTDRPGAVLSPNHEVAEVILEAIEKGDRLRYPVGQYAREVFAFRKQANDEILKTLGPQLGLTS